LLTLRAATLLKLHVEDIVTQSFTRFFALGTLVDVPLKVRFMTKIISYLIFALQYKFVSTIRQGSHHDDDFNQNLVKFQTYLMIVNLRGTLQFQWIKHYQSTRWTARLHNPAKDESCIAFSST